MRILITGSSGQIGTNLGLYLLERGHEVFGVDVRPNTWTDAIPTLLQDLAGSFADFRGGLGHVPYPPNLDDGHGSSAWMAFQKDRKKRT